MRRIFSEKIELILKSREAALSAVQIYNNPFTGFKTESFIVLFMVAWTYLAHAFFRDKKIEYRYYKITKSGKRRFVNKDGLIRYWELSKCISEIGNELSKATKNNLEFLIGLRNEIEHKKAGGLDSYLSGRYQACALNFNFYLKKFFGEKYSIDNFLALSLQFAELNYEQARFMKNKERFIPKNVQNYITKFDQGLSDNEIKDDQFSYRLLFIKVGAKRQGQADRVIEFVDPKSSMAKNIQKEYWVKEDREKPKYRPTKIVEKVRDAGYKDFSISRHTQYWKKYDGKNLSKGFGAQIAETWYWYENWFEFIISKLENENQ